MRGVALFAVAVALLLAAALWLSLPARHPGPFPVRFGGWTNLAGARHAILLFPPVLRSSPRHNFLLKRTYTLELELLLVSEDGAASTTAFKDRVGVLGLAAELLVPVGEQVTSISLLRAEGILGGYWDNEVFGRKPPFPPRERRWQFTPGEVVNLPVPTEAETPPVPSVEALSSPAMISPEL